MTSNGSYDELQASFTQPYNGNPKINFKFKMPINKSFS